MPVPPVPDLLARVEAIVPLRGLESAKTRLAPDLDAEERLALVTDMAERTLAACRDATSIAATILVTLDPAAARLAESYGARTIVQHLPGLNAAIREARSLAIEDGATAVLVLPIDLPLVSAAVLDDLVAEVAARLGAGGGAGRPDDGAQALVAIVPDRHGIGTNALLVAPPTAIEPAFGPDSRALHAAASDLARARRFELGGPLILDVDTPSDLMDVDPHAFAAASTSPEGAHGR